MPPDRQARCCIVGAGSAGIVAATTLHRLGYRHVTLLEQRADHVGGKCWTITRNNVPLDLGAVFVLPNYPTVTRLARQTRVRLRPAARFAHRDASGQTRPFGHPAQPPALHQKLAEYLRLGLQLVTYRRLLQHPIGEVPPAQLRGLTLPFAQWAAQHRLHYFLHAAYPLLRSFGFGFEDHAIPAAYIVKALPQFARNGNLLALWNVANIPLFHLAEGYGELWRRLAAPLDMRLGVEITRVERAEGGGVLQTDRGVVPFDHLILACPLDRALAFLDASVEERTLCSQIQTFPVWQAAVQIEGLPDALILDQHQAFPTLGQTMILFRYRRDASWYYLFGYARDGVNAEGIAQTIAGDIRELGGRMASAPLITHWPGYFPHYTADGVAAGYHARLERLQGQRATWYVGEIMANIGVEAVCAYAERLVVHHFA